MHLSVWQYSFLLVTECTCILLQYHKQNYRYYYGSVYTGGTGMEFFWPLERRHRHFPNPNSNLQNTLQKK